MASQQKVCYIYSACGGYFMYIEDLSNSKMPNNIIDLDNPFLRDGEYAKKSPNVILCDFASLCFCNVGDMLYMFEGAQIGLDMVKMGLDKAEDKRVYVFPLSTLDYILTSTHAIRRDEAQQSSGMLGPKVKPAAIRYLDNKILVFSTNIQFLTCDGNDFEMYFPGENKSWSLPCLSVCYFYCYENGVARYTLYDPNKRCAKIAERTVPEAGVRAHTCSFNITAFSLVGNDHLVVQTDFGLLFCLNLQHCEWHFWDGPKFPSGHQNFLTKDWLVLCHTGASVYTDDGHGRTVPFPLSSHVGPNYWWRNFFISLAHVNFPYYFLCILQVSSTQDDSPISTIDLVKVNTSKFMSYKDKDKDKDEDEGFAELVMSFRFVSSVWVGPVTPEGLFLY